MIFYQDTKRLALVLLCLAILPGCATYEADHKSRFDARSKTRCESGDMQYCIILAKFRIAEGLRTKDEAAKEFLTDCEAVSRRHRLDIVCSEFEDEIRTHQTGTPLKSKKLP